MNRLSLRYVYGISACLLLALIPVVVHAYLHLEVDDCRRTPLLLPQITRASTSAEKREAWMRDVFQSSLWNEGNFVKDGFRFDFSIIRSYDAKRLYHRPENYFADRAFVERRTVEWIPDDSGEIPIHRTYYGHTDSVTVLAYLLVYRSSAVASPYWAQLRAAPLELFSGRYPMTLFLIQTHGPAARLGTMEAMAREWLISEWQSYRSACKD